MVPSTFYRFLYFAAQTCCSLFKPYVTRSWAKKILSYCLRQLHHRGWFARRVCQGSQGWIYCLGGVSSFSKNWYLIYLAEKAEYIVWKVFHLYQFNLISNLSNRVWSVRAEYFIWNWLIFVLKFYPEVHLIWSRVCQEWLPRMTRLNILMLFGLRLEFFKTYLEM